MSSWAGKWELVGLGLILRFQESVKALFGSVFLFLCLVLLWNIR